MKAIEIAAPGGAEIMKISEVPTPTPGPGQVLIRIAAIGVNYIDVYYREGRYKAAMPLTIGSEASGVVDAVGDGVTGFAVGDKVASWAVMGSYAELALVPASQLVKVPEGLDMKLAAASLLQGMTAHYLVHSTYALKAGDTALVHAAAGGTGLLLTQMATALGARVIATVSTDEKARLARAAGAAEVILYTQADFETEARRLTGGRGVDVVYDSVGRTTFEKSLGCLRQRGLLALFGASSGAVPPFDVIQLSTKGSLFLTRPALGNYLLTREEQEWRAGDVFSAVKNGKLKIDMKHVYPLAEAAQAHVDLEGRKTSGKLLLVP